MEEIYERCAGLDVHRDQVTACVRVPSPGGGRAEQQAEFSTTTDGLLQLLDWLVSHRVTNVAMEATGVFWRPVFYLLEDHMETIVVNAAHMRNVPGRKDRHRRRCLDCPTSGAWTAQGQFHPARADSGAKRAHALPQDPDPGASAGS